MNSMTGHGRGEASKDGFKLSIEISSVNRKQMDISVNLPRPLDVLEPRIRDAINHRISRGRVNVRVTLSAASGVDQVRINRPLAAAYAREMASLAGELGLTGGVTLDAILRVPGVLQSLEDSSSPEEQFWPPLEKAIDQALKGLSEMRHREGLHLADDLRARMATLQKAVVKIQKQAPKVAKRYREALKERVAGAGLALTPEDDERVTREVVFYADRSDITEELTRLESHFKQFEQVLKSKEPVGRTLDFLSQEMNREINTIGSKANDAVISREVVVAKAELERFREQVQNVE